MYGNVLYEYIDTTATELANGIDISSNSIDEGSTGDASARTSSDRRSKREKEELERDKDDRERHDDEGYLKLLNSLFGGDDVDEEDGNDNDKDTERESDTHSNTKGSSAAQKAQNSHAEPHAGQYLSYVYPLVDLKVIGVRPEKLGGKQCFSLTFLRKDGKSMRCMKRDSENEGLLEHHKTFVTLIFNSESVATQVCVCVCVCVCV